MPINFTTTNPVSDSFNTTTTQIEADRAARLKMQQEQDVIDQQRGIDQAIRESYQPDAGMGQGSPQQAQNLAQQVSSSPAQAQPLQAAPAAPIPLQPPSSLGTSTPAPQQEQPYSRISPFDTPDYSSTLMQKLSKVPGGGEKLLAIKKQRDAQIAGIVEMAANGNIDEARYFAKQNGLNIPEQLYRNGDLARAASLAHKAYPEDPDKADTFIQSYLASQGDMQTRALASLKVAGKPSTAAQRSLATSIALAKFNDQQNADKPVMYQGADQGLYGVTPAGNVTPVTMDSGEIFKPMGGPGIHAMTADSRPKVMNTASNGVVWVNPMTKEVKTLVPPGQKLSLPELTLRIYEKNIANAGREDTPQSVMANSKQMAQELMGGVAASSPAPDLAPQDTNTGTPDGIKLDSPAPDYSNLWK